MSPSPTPVRLRPAAASDLPRLHELERAAHTHPWSEAQLRSELGRAYATVLCAETADEAGARIDGFVVCWLIHDELHVLDVVTAPEARRRGIGRALMDESLADGARRGATRAMLEVRRSNAPAIALYRALGFLHDTVRRRYYPDGEDALLMSLVLVR
ncbi:MAG TPA: ribosomal protein S18-alanine N-acetyltransferase [Anaeromyxobacteraceae bacterium]|nr:ribosomal protein S18-alanine N-acetyltransferase [Anaeromyxobacteraceae bacterium]